MLMYLGRKLAVVPASDSKPCCFVLNGVRVPFWKMPGDVRGVQTSPSSRHGPPELCNAKRRAGRFSHPASQNVALFTSKLHSGAWLTTKNELDFFTLMNYRSSDDPRPKTEIWIAVGSCAGHWCAEKNMTLLMRKYLSQDNQLERPPHQVFIGTWHDCRQYIWKSMTERGLQLCSGHSREMIEVNFLKMVNTLLFLCVRL